MKKQLLLCLVACSTVLFFSACSKSTKDDPTTTVITGISLDKTTLSLAVSGTYTLTATISPSTATDKTVTWTSSDVTKATVSNGLVTAVGAGTVTITAQVGSQTATCVVTISTVPIAVTGISLDKTALALTVGGTSTLTATVSPSTATDKTVVWTSSDVTKATVSNGLVTAVAVGTATITAKSGTQTTTCVVTITGIGVLINGVRWATCNVAAPGTFATNSEDAGMLYKWNSKVGLPATGTISGWISAWNGGYTNPSSSDTWISVNDPSPAGYRVPTRDEIQTLVDANKVTGTWTSQNSVYGKKFTDKNTGNSIFLPASGIRSYTDGSLGYIGTYGDYWSSTADDIYNAYYLFSSSSDAYWNYQYRANALPIRPVVE